MKLQYIIFLYITLLFPNIYCTNEVGFKNIETTRNEYIKLRDKIKALEDELENLRAGIQVCNMRLLTVVDHFNSIGNISLNVSKSPNCSRGFASNYISKAYNILYILYSTLIKIIRKKFIIYRNLDSSFILLYLNLFPKFLKDAYNHCSQLFLQALKLNSIFLDSTVIRFLRMVKNHFRESLQYSFTELCDNIKIREMDVCKDLNKLGSCSFNSNSALLSYLKFSLACPSLTGSYKRVGRPFDVFIAMDILIDDYLICINQKRYDLLPNGKDVLLHLWQVLYKTSVFISLNILYGNVYAFNWISKQMARVMEGELTMSQLRDHLLVLMKTKIEDSYLKVIAELDVLTNALKWLDNIYQMAIESNPEFASIAPETTIDCIILFLFFIIFNWFLLIYIFKLLRITILRKKKNNR